MLVIVVCTSYTNYIFVVLVSFKEWEHEYIKTNMASFCWQHGKLQTDIWHIGQALELTAFEWKHVNARSCVYYALENDMYEFRYQCRENYETTSFVGPIAGKGITINPVQ